jgi:hypothetical protein
LVKSDATRDRYPELYAKVCGCLGWELLQTDASRSRDARTLYEKAFQHSLHTRKEGTTRAECLSSRLEVMGDIICDDTQWFGFANKLVLDAVRRLEDKGGIQSDKDHVLLQAIELMAANIVYLEAKTDADNDAGNGGGNVTSVMRSSESQANPVEALCNIMCALFEQSLGSPLQAELKDLLHATMHARFTAWGDASKREDLAMDAARLIGLPRDITCTSDAANLNLALWCLSKHTLGPHHEVSVSILTALPDPGSRKLDQPAQEAVLQMLAEGVQGAENARSGQTLAPYRPAAHMELLMRYTRHLLAAGKEISSLGAKVLNVMEEIRDEDMVDRYGRSPIWLYWLLDDNKAALQHWSCARDLLALIVQRVDAVRSKWDDYNARRVERLLLAAIRLALSAVTPPPNQQQAQELTAPEPTTSMPADLPAPLVSHSRLQNVLIRLLKSSRCLQIC